MDYVLLTAAVAIGAVIATTIVTVLAQRARERQAESELAATIQRGALPPSLHPKVDLDKCIGSGACVQACPEVDVLGLIDGKARVVNPTACIGHGECRVACPVDAITLVLGTERRGVDIPFVAGDFETNVPGLYVVGELGGMGLIYNAMTQALQCVQGLRRTMPPAVEGVHQLAIVGAGPAGLAASVAALDAKLDFVTLDQESIGGTVLQYPRQKIVMTRPVELPGYGRLKVASIEKEALLEAWRRIIDTTGLQIRAQTTVTAVRREPEGVFVLETTKGPVRAQRVILALGRRGTPRKLGVPGEELSKVTYRLLEPESYQGRRCLVVGGGDSAIEAAIALGDEGAVVHLAHRRRIFDRIKPKNQARLNDATQDGRVTVLYEASVSEIRPASVTVQAEGRMLELANDFVFAMIGGVLPTAFLQAAGVEVQTYTGQAYAPANM